MKPIFILLALCSSLLVSAGALPSSDTADKEAAARAIFEQLVRARGDQRMPPPEFIFTTQKANGARAEDGKVILEELAYDVCSGLGEDGETALAGLLGHELIHYYEKHEWEGGFISVVRGEDAEGSRALTRAVKENLFALKKDEIEADYLGGFLAHLAGYPSTDVMPRVLEGIYAAYELEEEQAKYPTLSERKLIATETHRELTGLINVFTMGNALTTLQRYPDALTYYEHVLDHFQSREIYNNLGVVYVQAALPMFKAATVKYLYPVELDLDSRLDGQTRNVGVDRETREYYLRQAIRNFQRAQLLDDQYAVAQLNQACVHALLAQSMQEAPAPPEQAELARDHLLEAGIRARAAIRRAEARGLAQTAANGHLLLGIVAALEGRPAAVGAAWGRAGASPLTALNQSIHDTGNLPPKKERPADDFAMEETLDDRSITDVRDELPEWQEELMIMRRPDRIRLQSYRDDASATALLRHEVNGGREALLIFQPTENYAGETALELSLGARREAIIEEYDQPDYFVPTAGGLTLVYEQSGIVFVLRDDVLVSWWLFSATE
ncbi:hypothetical protein [Lewinella sp. W8]|uniref:hypothetical protein n=1 Tax=Lewinella sp. W8 TaxID=2528208 RepID=UPI001068A9AC|nr:hypothetical protein [Lewinella sp. W8]MTB52797.1 hypothetical protein [Lewinella sp. W8]